MLLTKIQANFPNEWRSLVDAFAQSEELIGMEWGKMDLEAGSEGK